MVVLRVFQRKIAYRDGHLTIFKAEIRLLGHM
jgi:hypothetical protein